MKKLLISIISFSSIMFSSCGYKSTREATNNPYIYVEKIGNHEYLIYKCGYAGGICHYEDCKYCNEITDKNNK